MTAEALALRRLMTAAHRAAVRQGLSWYDAEDVASVALVDFYETSKDITHPLAWIRVVASRRALDFLRREATRGQKDAIRTSYFAPCFNQLEHVEDLLDLQAALDVLSPRERRAFISRYMEGERLDTIAASTGFSRATLHRRLNQRRRSLLRTLTGHSRRRSQRPSRTGTADDTRAPARPFS